MKKLFSFMPFIAVAVLASLSLVSCGQTPTGPGGGGSSPTVTPTVTSGYTVSYDLTVTGNTNSFGVTYIDNAGVSQVLSVPVGGVTWVYPTCTMTSGQTAGITITFPIPVTPGKINWNWDMWVNGSHTYNPPHGGAWGSAINGSSAASGTSLSQGNFSSF